MRLSVGYSKAARQQGACRPRLSVPTERLAQAPTRAPALVARTVAEDLPEVSDTVNGAVPAAQMTTKKLPKSAPPFVLLGLCPAPQRLRSDNGSAEVE